jgi:hypothetical protein
MTRLACFVALAALGAIPLAASAQWSDNFDGYLPGSINGQGGWKGWDNVALGAGNVVTAPTRSSPHSQQVGGAADSVRQYSGVNSGAWTYTAWQYIPGNFSGTTYFILTNTYADGGPYDWSVELQFDGGTGLILDDFRTENPVSFLRDQWAEIRIDFDLTADTQSTYYNGALLSTGTWTTAGTSALNLACVDLFANGSSSVYYDDMSLVPVPGSAGLLCLAGLLATRRRR